MARIERRSHPRWHGDSLYPVRVRIGDQVHAAALRNISAGGAALSASFDVELGSALVVEINDDVHLPGQLIRRDADTLAIRFALAASIAEPIDQVIRAGVGPAQW